MTCSRCGREEGRKLEKFEQNNLLGQYLEETDYSGLCSLCEKDLTSQLNKRKKYPFPGPNGDLLNGIHYYTENGLMVFTELYHIARGYCCENNCRHCSYKSK